MTLKPNLETSETAARRELRASRPAPNIVLFSIDGLRTDHVGAYGYKRHPTTPNIDRLAKRGRLFKRAYSSYPTTQNFNTMLLLGRFVPQFSDHNPPLAYQEQAITRLLDKRHYHILVKSWFEHTTGNSFNPAVYGIDTHLPKAKSKSIRLEAPLEERLASIEKHLAEARQKSLPIFIWTHLLGTHHIGGKFIADDRFAFGDAPLDRYDSAIAASDTWLPEYERLLAKYSDPNRDTIWIVCSDHGVKERTAGRDLSNAITQVPLVIVGPGVSPGIDDYPVDVSLDLAATIVDFIGIAPPPSYDGVSLLPLLQGSSAEEMSFRLIPLLYSRWKGAIYKNYKYREQRDGRSLFDLRHDPEERQNVIGKFPALAAQMAAAADEALTRRSRSYREGEARAAAADVEVGDEG
jgi:arylsulfatase A-like enzyme